MARPTKLTPVRHARIIDLLRHGVPFATACRSVGVSPSAAYEWLYRGWGTHPDRPPAPVYVAFARAVDAVFPGGFAERYDDEFADAQSNGETTSRDGFAEGEPFLQFLQSVTREDVQAPEPFAEPQNRPETDGDPGTNEPLEEFAEGFSDTPRDRARAREDDGAEEFSEFSESVARARVEPDDVEPRRAPMPWVSKRSREAMSILDMDF